MAYSTIGVVVEKSRDNLVFVTEIQTGRAFVVTDKAAKKSLSKWRYFNVKSDYEDVRRCGRRLSICLV
jgi:hypothetical protein